MLSIVFRCISEPLNQLIKKKPSNPFCINISFVGPPLFIKTHYHVSFIFFGRPVRFKARISQDRLPVIRVFPLLKELSQDNALTIVNYILKIFESHTVLVCQGKLLVFAIHLCTMTSSDEETLNSVIPEIMSLIRKNWKDKSNPLFSELRLLIITPSQWLRVFNGDMKLHHEVIEFASIEQLGKRPYIRGDILAFFSRLEGLVREIIQARILGLFLFSAKAEEFDQILQKVGFNNSIRLLVEWGVIKGSLQNKIDKLNGIRNKLAHSWDERDVYYDRKTGVRILDNIVEFRKDAKEVWLELIKVYMKAEVKDIGNLMVKLGDYNTINVWNDIIKERKSQGYTDEE